MADMITRCPQCATAFRITAAHLKLAQGSVRCGACFTIFNALENLSDRNGQSGATQLADDMLISDSMGLDDEDDTPAEKTASANNPTKSSLFERDPNAKGKADDEDPDESWALELLQDEELDESPLKETAPSVPAAKTPQAQTPRALPQASKTPPQAPKADSQAVKAALQAAKSAPQPGKSEPQAAKPEPQAAKPEPKTGSTQPQAAKTTQASKTQADTKTQPQPTKPEPPAAAPSANANSSQSTGSGLRGTVSKVAAAVAARQVLQAEQKTGAASAVSKGSTPEKKASPVAESRVPAAPTPVKPAPQAQQPSSQTARTKPVAAPAAPAPRGGKTSEGQAASPASLKPASTAPDQAGAARERFDLQEQLAKEHPELNAEALRDLQAALEEAKPSRSTDNARLIDRIEPEPLEVTYASKRRLNRQSVWFAGSLGLMALAALQLGVMNMAQWRYDTPLAPAYEIACSYLPCPTQIRRDVSRIIASSLLVKAHPETPGALVADAVLVNKAGYVQPFPTLILSFRNLHNHLVAERAFTPEEYLGGELAGQTQMPIKQSIHIALEIEDPGKEAVSYSLSTSL
jgi:predicted Zn finger-like uncharacterized protein